MNAKSLNILLVVVLCYGQLVANLHAIGHVHSQESQSAEADCHGDLRENTSRNIYSHVDCHFSAADHTTPPDTNTEGDCAIYHALLNLSGAIYAVQTDVFSSLHHVEISRLTSIHLSGSTYALQRIRAPPLLS